MIKQPCCLCGKESEVSVVVVRNGRKSLSRFCRECTGSEDFPGKVERISGRGSRRKTPEYCPACGYPYRDFREYRFLGCPECYSHFGKEVDRYLKRIHSSLFYKGKTPSRTDPDNLKKGKGLSLSRKPVEK